MTSSAHIVFSSRPAAEPTLAATFGACTSTFPRGKRTAKHRRRWRFSLTPRRIARRACCGKKEKPADIYEWLGAEWDGEPLPRRIEFTDDGRSIAIRSAPGCGCLTRLKSLSTRLGAILTTEITLMSKGCKDGSCDMPTAFKTDYLRNLRRVGFACAHLACWLGPLALAILVWPGFVLLTVVTAPISLTLRQRAKAAAPSD